MILLLSLLFPAATTPVCRQGPPPITVSRGFQFEIPLTVDNLTGPGSWGNGAHVADHAVVAMNSEKDILVAYDTNRPDLGQNVSQIEVAMFHFIANDSWEYRGNILLGDAHVDSLGYGVPLIRCERPDVVAAGSAFLVHWTRRYTTLPNHPAAQECAWIQWDQGSQSFKSYTNLPPASGQGFVFDKDGLNGLSLWVKECAGVPDAVLLDDSTSVVTAGIVYLHQKNFSGGSSLIRDFQMRFATTAFDTANPGVPFTTTSQINLITTVRFDGPDNDSAGLILPEVAEGSTKDRFILAYEEQLETAPGSGSYFGRIALHRVDWIGGTWSSQQSHTFGSATGTLLSRRRPMIDAYRAASLAAGKELVSIAFNRINPTVGDADVVYEEWAMDPVNGAYRVLWPSGIGWDNDPGGVAQYDFRRLLCARFLNPPPPPYQPPPPMSPRDMLEYRMATDDYFLLETGDLGRPAADYQHDASSPEPDYVVVTWEQATAGQADTRLQILAR